ncbi:MULTISPECIES: ribulose-phosphate 3-epimerase [unclassified Paenibacillus]|uniref:ribulose-phosphate 3-epimerase n=1 Tax=unclassified Paenibacillus TaxID=185978 RepID=UPI000839B438|nr:MULTISPECIES: ribulose-phosphate 3-epimerase [unclassified Paenibacillus]NWL87494.1 ribulose-phosphate 3-epimerase [Paenibacillus sp. 79R4]
MNDIYIAPSILSADFAKLGQEVVEAEHSGADWLHVDVMDGHFVPNITFGALVMGAIAPLTKLPLDVHLMIENPERYIPDFAKAGAHLITVHQEACVHLHRVLHMMKEHGVKTGVAINPATPVSSIREVLEDVDLVLVMTVNPGFGGQAFIPSTLRKIRELKELREELGLKNLRIEVDGGISAATAPLVVEAGADVLVAGNAVFGRSDRRAAIQEIRSSLQD